MASLAEIEDELTRAQGVLCKSTWAAFKVEFSRPDEYPTECDMTRLPVAYVVLVDQLSAHGDREADRCGGWAYLHYELHLRDCSPSEGGSREWLARRTARAAEMRAAVRALAISLGHVARWQGDIITPASTRSDLNEGEKTMRTACRFEWLVQSDDELY